MTPEDLADIRERVSRPPTWPSPELVEADCRELLAYVDELEAQLAVFTKPTEWGIPSTRWAGGLVGYHGSLIIWPPEDEKEARRHVGDRPGAILLRWEVSAPREVYPAPDAAGNPGGVS